MEEEDEEEMGGGREEEEGKDLRHEGGKISSP